MSFCPKCGNPVEFRYKDGVRIPLHLDGRCTSGDGTAAPDRFHRSDDGTCIKTRCPVCSGGVYFVRHNGGSVWLDPPLGPPWSVHECMKTVPLPAAVTSPTVVVPAEFADTIERCPGSIAGVVIRREISADGSQSILGISVGEQDELALLVRGRAAIAGVLVRVDCSTSYVKLADREDIGFRIIACLHVPDAFSNANFRLPPLLSPSDFNAVRERMAPKPPSAYDGLSIGQAKVLRRYREQGLSATYKCGELVILALLLQGREQDEIVHKAAIAVLEHASTSMDVTSARALVDGLPPVKRGKLIAWFTKFAPIQFGTRTRDQKVRLWRGSGQRPPFRIDEARREPFYAL